MSLRNFGLILAAATAFAASPAHATGGWDWDEDFAPDHWRTATLQWAHDIHPNHPPIDLLLQAVAAPPDEPWCHAPPVPTLDDCDIHDGLIDGWLHEYLGIPFNQPLPAQMIPYPYECPSPCAM